MHEKLFNDWVSALRSGKYNQGYGYLKTKNGYCCLGVLCKVAGKNLVYNPGIDDYKNYEWLIEEIFTTDELNEIKIKLMNMNDSKQSSFKNIADYLEEIKEKLITIPS